MVTVKIKENSKEASALLRYLKSLSFVEVQEKPRYNAATEKVISDARAGKDFKKAKKRGLDSALFKKVINILTSEGKLPSEYKPHKLKGKYNGLWECHIQPDWLLIWDMDNDIKLITLLRTGSHIDLF